MFSRPWRFGERLELLEMAGPVTEEPAAEEPAAEEPAADIDIEHFRTFGFLLLRKAFDPGPLSEEMDRSFSDGRGSSFEVEVGGRQLGGAYVPMMCERTPVSLSLLERFAEPATRLLASPVLPVRAKGVLYFGSADWHRDSDRDVASVGFVAYLERLEAGKGALRLIPGSHHGDFGRALEKFGWRRPASLDPSEAAAGALTLPGYPVPTEPGDVIVFDEHLYHASAGGRNRRQWRVDYVQDPRGAKEEQEVRSYFSALYRPDWDGGYDVDGFPSYGAHWRASGRPWVDRLAELGAYEAADREELFARSRHR